MTKSRVHAGFLIIFVLIGLCFKVFTHIALSCVSNDKLVLYFSLSYTWKRTCLEGRLTENTGSFLQMLWSFQRSSLLIQPFLGPYVVWYVSYQSLSRSWHTDLDCGSYRSSNLQIGLMAGVTGQQGMLTPSWHLIPPLIYTDFRVRPFSDLYFLWDLWDNYCSLFLSFLSIQKRQCEWNKN